jgi:sialic acid synthase SpsE
VDSVFCIDGKDYHPKNILIIAELGTSHGADPVKARELVDAAAEAGAGAVKSQIVYAGEILHPNTANCFIPAGEGIRFEDIR